MITLQIFSVCGLRINRKSYLERGVENSNLNSELFIRKYIYEPLKKIILDLLFNHGIMLEFHSQNVLLEYDNNYIPTGVFFYRDFDMTSYDRARFPFIHFEEWKERDYVIADLVVAVAANN